MSSLRALSILILGSCFAATGCIVDAEQPSPFEAGDLEVPLEETGLGCGNGITPSCFWDHDVQMTLRKLAGDGLDRGGYLPDMPDVPPSCYRVIKDTVECALKPGVALKNPHDGEYYEGLAGLAPHWETKPLEDTDSRELVTACLVQRLNAFGVQVPILLEGDHPSIEENLADDAIYPFNESTAQGDLFSSTDDEENKPAFSLYVCSEKDLDMTCRGEGGYQLDTRICDTAGSLCGLVYLGPCSTACTQNGSYWKCNGSTNTIRVQLEKAACVK